MKTHLAFLFVCVWAFSLASAEGEIVPLADRDQNGKISKPEGDASLTNYILKKGDKDGSGCMTKKEAAAAFPASRPSQKVPPGVALKQGVLDVDFAKADKNHDGVVSRAELNQAIKQSSRSEWFTESRDVYGAGSDLGRTNLMGQATDVGVRFRF